MIRREWLRRDLGTLDLYALVHADSQSTFYLLIGFIALYSGGLALAASIYAVALLVAVSMVYGEIGSRFPETGGSYLYVRHSFGRLLGFASTWLLMLDQAIMVSYGSLDASKYALAVAGLDWIPPQIPAVAVSTALLVLCLVGVRESARVALAVAAIDLAVVGVLLVGLNLAQGFRSPPPGFGWQGVEAPSLVFALSLASRGFTGIDAIGQLAGEAREPLVQVPRASALAAVLGAFFSLSLTAILMDKIPYSSLSPDPSLVLLAIAAATPFPLPILPLLVASNIVVIMVMAALAGYVAFSRLLYILSQDRLVPGLLTRLHPRFRTPYIALFISFLISTLFIIPGEIEFIVEVYAVGSLTNYLIVSLSLWRIGSRDELLGGFTSPRIWGVPITSIAGVALTLAGLILNILEKALRLWILGLWLLAGLSIYYALSRRSKG